MAMDGLGLPLLERDPAYISPQPEVTSIPLHHGGRSSLISYIVYVAKHPKSIRVKFLRLRFKLRKREAGCNQLLEDCAPLSSPRGSPPLIKGQKKDGATQNDSYDYEDTYPCLGHHRSVGWASTHTLITPNIAGIKRLPFSRKFLPSSGFVVFPYLGHFPGPPFRYQ